MDIEILVKQLSKLGIVFDKEITEDLIDAYHEDLEEMSNQQMTDASNRWRKEGKFFPRPSQLLDMIVSADGSASDAWQLVLKELRNWREAKLPPDVLIAVNRVGGLKSLAMMDMKNLEFKGKEFKTEYQPDRVEEVKRRLGSDPKMEALGKMMRLDND
ncbi:MAG: hypothetical protein V3W52_17075 [Syntrophobacteria bacterium]